MRYILSFVILLVGYAGAVFAFLSFHPLGILPFYTSFMSLIIWALHEYPQVAGLRLDRSNQPRGDEEQGILLRDGSSAASATQTQTQNDAPVNISVRRRNSNPARDPLPDPLIFYDDEDADNDNVAPLRRDANVGTPQN
ncbi:hypothetical protein DM02DRAFT_613289 [Periconia macrospinosa]|uniref:Uncharacterized protein n=1 Tax=Periconia macrospinosa TaxID=97972 RepID=A0A2V1DUG8_9PLEO|nr:hypothetical protein DM02DRAFT_613289 [Periconia macrospinosa]